jgi:protein ImuA
LLRNIPFLFRNRGMTEPSMHTAKSDIINRLKREILPLEGFGNKRPGSAMELGLEFMREAFAEDQFPLGAVHELISEGAEAASSTAGFTSGILSGLMKNGGAAVWISKYPILFPPALKTFGIAPDQVIFINLKKENDILWTMEEALKCASISAVIGEMTELSFTHTRRFQLAVEKSKTTGFILRNNPRILTPNSCVARWKIKPLPSISEDGLPGIGYPTWEVDLQKIRNGKPQSWSVEWRDGKFQEVKEVLPAIILQPLRSTRKTG